MMVEQQVLDRIRAATSKTARSMTIIGLCIVAFGLFIISLHAFELDSETADMGTGMLALLYIMALTFIVTGGLMVRVGLFKFGAMGRAVVGALSGDASVLQKVAYTTIQAAAAPGKPGRVHQLRFDIGGKGTVITVREEDVEPILAYVREKAPHALSGEN